MPVAGSILSPIGLRSRLISDLWLAAKVGVYRC